MDGYRVYILNDDGHISQPPKEITGEDDDDAIEQAKAVLNGHDVEVWRRDRLIVRLSSPDK